MKKALALILILVMALTMVIPVAHAKETVVEEEIIILPNTWKYNDDYNFDGFQGRLFIPSVDIDVALYDGCYQYITDRDDSANLYDLFHYTGKVIADHKHQEFEPLKRVEVGMFGYIVFPDNTAVKIQCVSIIDGHNTETYLTDANYIPLEGPHDYLMYTCMANWQNIRICEWDVVPNTCVYVKTGPFTWQST